MVQEKSVTLTQSVRVGLIHSLSGTMAISERPLLEAELMAIDEINKTGGILGCQIEPVTMDGASNPETFAQKAQELLSSGVQFLFGCWTSASRKAVKPIVEDADGLLWYPVQYEGLEESEHIVYTGSCPVQQIVPAVEWVLAHIGSRVFLVGSDYVFPRTANKLVRSQVENRGGSIVGERYVPQGGMSFTSIIEEIQRQKPDAVFSTVFGESNLAFYREYHAAGIDAQSIPIMAVCISETELQPIADVAAGHYACRNYFQSLNRPENHRFVANYKKRCGEASVCSAPMAMAYTQIHLWKRAAEAAGSLDVTQVRSHVVGCELLGPAGPIVIEANHHTSMCAYIGRATPHGQFEVLDSTAAIRPWPWLGIEDSKLPYKTAVKQAMAAYPEVQNALVELAVADKGFRESSRLNSLLLENMLDVVAQTDLVGSCEYASPSMKTVLGYDPKDMLGKSMFEYVHPDDLDNVVEIVRKALVAGTTAKFEYRYKHADGNYVWLESHGNPLLGEKGQVTGAVLSSRDITQRKKMEEVARESEDRYRTLFDSTNDAIFIHDMGGKFLETNKGACERLGYSREELFRMTPADINSPQYAATVAQRIEELRKVGHSLSEIAQVRRNGTIIPTELSSRIIDYKGKPAVLSIARDITERKRAEEALLATEAKYRQLVENIDELIYAGQFGTSAMVSPLTFMSDQVERILGYRAKEFLDDRSIWGRTLHPDDMAEVQATMQMVIEGKNVVRVYRMKKRNSEEYCWLEDHIVPQVDSTGRVTGYFGVARDITERKKAENALKESEERYKAIFEGASDGFLAADLKTNKFVFANPKICEITGYSLKELLELNVNDIHPKEDLPFVIDQFTKQAQGTLDVAKDIPILRKDKTVLYCDISSKVIEIGGQKRLVGFFRDITERKQIERMKDQFVSTVSHELRTPLTSIRASLGLLASGMSGTLPEKGQRMLEIAVTNTDRLVRLINDILDSERLASGKTPMEKKQCSAAQFVTQAADVMKPMAEKAGISLSVESQDAVLWADPDRIAQALTNLVSNAIKFSPKGGRIWVTAERRENQMVFKVRDEGRGIPPDKLGLLFERFQQVDASDAREKGGTGLGLSISKSIVEQHSGRIWVESTVGKGSTFFFTLPLPQETEAPVQPEATTEAQSTTRVLIIEDDPDLASILATMLQRHNIQPHLALHGRKGHSAQQTDAPRHDCTRLGSPGHGWLSCGSSFARRQYPPVTPLGRVYCERTQ